MRTSQYILSTLKETPANAEVISHQLMLRAGLIRPVASGLYTWLPTGLKVLKKVENIVREEMQKAGAIEVLMPMVQPAELWEESGRWDDYGPELLRISDRHQRPFVLGPTHEEVITKLVSNEISSYKQLPLNVFQIQTKFRDEIRSRFGVMRGREFLMKDAYSFHLTEDCLKQTYQVMYQAYCNIFERLGLDYRPVLADTGSIGGDASHEFHVLAASGEDDIVFSNQSDYAANIEKAEALAPTGERAEATQALTTVDTPEVKTIEQVAQFFNVDSNKIAKTLIVHGANSTDENPELIALILRGDHQLNEIKAEKHPAILAPLCMASDAEIQDQLQCEPGAIGPVGLTIKIIADRSAAHLADFIAGANQDGKHLTGVNWLRDTKFDEVADLRNVVAGDPSPCGKGTLEIKRGIEVGHIFQLGKKYADAMNCGVLTESGKHETLFMGCYGVGVSRIVAAAIEQNHDDNGIKWPTAIAPFAAAIVPMNMHKSARVQQVAEKLYQELQQAGIEILFDDRKERPGVMFNDHELMGTPYLLVVGERNLDTNQIEVKNRITGEKQLIDIDQVGQLFNTK